MHCQESRQGTPCCTDLQKQIKDHKLKFCCEDAQNLDAQFHIICIKTNLILLGLVLEKIKVRPFKQFIIIVRFLTEILWKI